MWTHEILVQLEFYNISNQVTDDRLVISKLKQ